MKILLSILFVTLLFESCSYMLTITSEPSGASVDMSTLYYKGKRVGVVKTPATIKLNNWDRAGGDLLVFKNGYNPGSVSFMSWWGKDVACHCVLKPKEDASQNNQVTNYIASTAFLYLGSNVGLIEVYADEKFIGKVNETKESFKVNSGNFNLIAKKDGIEIERISVSLNENEGFMYVFNSKKPSNIKNEQLNVESSKTSQLTVISQNPDISIIFNGFERILPYQTKLKAGEYKTIVRIGFKTYNKKIIIPDGEDITIDLDKEVFQ